MAAPYFSLTPASASELVLVDGTGLSTGYDPLADATTLGDPLWEFEAGAAVGTLGAPVTVGDAQNREASVTIRIVGSTGTEMASRLATLEQALDQLRTRGGIATYRKNGHPANVRSIIRVLSCSWAVTEYGARAERAHVCTVVATLTCAPYVEGEPMAWEDDFSSDGFAATSARWSTITGTPATISGGKLSPGATGTTRLLAAGPGYVYGDVEVEAAYVPGLTTGYFFGVLLRMRPGAETTYHLRCAIDSAGRLSITRMAAGVETELAFVTGNALVAGTRYWMRARIEGNIVTVEQYALGASYGDRRPTLSENPTYSLTFTLTALDAGRFPTGYVGLFMQGGSTTNRVDAFRLGTVERTLTAPCVIDVQGALPGSLDADADIDVVAVSPTDYGLVAWGALDTANLVGNGTFVRDTNGWSIAALSGISNAATSIAAATTEARFGTSCGQVVCSGALVTQGVVYRVPAAIRRASHYLAVAWLKATTGTNPLRIVAGPTSGPSVGASINAATTWKLHTVLRQAASNVDEYATVSVQNVNAVAQTFQVDGVVVCETWPIALAADPGTGGTTLSLDGVVPDEWPAAPFLAVVEPGTAASELVLVTAAAKGSSSITVLRGQETTTAAAHAIGVTVCPLPKQRTIVEGAGGAPPLCVLEAEYLRTVSGLGAPTPADTVKASTSGGRVARWTATGNQYVVFEAPLDTSLLVDAADDSAYEVYCLCTLPSTIVQPSVVLSAVDGDVQGDPFAGTKRDIYSSEFGSLGVAPPVPTAAANLALFLGTLRLGRGRWNLNAMFLYQAGSSGTVDVDCLIVVPAAHRLAGLEAPPNDTSLAYKSWATDTESTIRRIRSDLLGWTSHKNVDALNPPVAASRVAPPLGGATIEPPSGRRVRWLVWKAQTAPNVQTAPTLNAGTGDTNPAHGLTTLRLLPTPRWGRLRNP